MKSYFKNFMYVATLLASGAAAQDTIDVVMETSEGTIEIELYADKAPLTVKNFLRYVDGEHLDGRSFYRVVTPENDKGHPTIEVIQGGRRRAPSPFGPIVHETTRDTGIRHVDGVISMARGKDGTASSEFFICIGEQPGLNYGARRNPDRQGFAAFGKVTHGMSVDKKINQLPTTSSTKAAYIKGQILEEPMAIIAVRRK